MKSVVATSASLVLCSALCQSADLSGALYLTARSSPQRLAKIGDLQFVPSPELPGAQRIVFLDPSKTFQTILGISGTLTDASAETFYKLPQAARQEILRAYFDPVNGIGYSPGRFSKFIRPGARRIISSTTSDQLLTVAFINQDGKIAVVVMNPGDQGQKFSFYLKGQASAAEAPAHSMLTLVL